MPSLAVPGTASSGGQRSGVPAIGRDTVNPSGTIVEIGLGMRAWVVTPHHTASGSRRPRL